MLNTRFHRLIRALYLICLGQHLITAIFEQDYKFNTTTWNLGTETSFIELDTKAVTVEQLREAEDKINLTIALGRPVSVITTEKDANLAPEVSINAFKLIPPLTLLCR